MNGLKEINDHHHNPDDGRTDMSTQYDDFLAVVKDNPIVADFLNEQYFEGGFSFFGKGTTRVTGDRRMNSNDLSWWFLILTTVCLFLIIYVIL